MAKTPDQLKGWLRSRRQMRGSAEVAPGVGIVVRGDYPITVVDNKFLYEPLPGQRPCPFCGASQTRTSFALPMAFWKSGFNVECWKCGARGPSRVTKQRAIAGWNCRTEQEGGQCE